MSLIKNSTWNVIGYLIPSIIAIPVMGVMSRKLGMENFGLFTLMFAIIGYASIFDAGLTRAVVRVVAINKNNNEKIISITGTAVWAVFILSLIAMIFIIAFSDEVVGFLNVSPEYYNDVVLSLRLMGLSVPLFLIAQVWLGCLEGLEKFTIINKQRIFTSTLIALLPLIFLYFENKLSFAIAGLILARFITLIVVAIISKKIIYSLFYKLNIVTLKQLLNFGGWLTVSNIISPVMVYFDRFILSHLSGANVVSQYTAPSDLVNRLGVFPGSIAKALFPKLSNSNDSYKQGVLLLLFTSVILVVPLFFFAERILTLWLGAGYAGKPSIVLKILLVGFFFNSIAQAPFAAIQAKGHAKITAYIHLIELLPYLILLVFLTYYWSVVGAALAWLIRVVVDCIILFLIERKI